MLARNSDLYSTPSASWWARCSSSCGLFDLQFFVSMSGSGHQQRRLLLSSELERCSSSCWTWSSSSGLELGGQPLRLAEQLVGAGLATCC